MNKPVALRGPRRGHSIRLLILALAVGGVAAGLVFELQRSPEDMGLAQATVNPQWCLGQRSKAERIAYWRARTGLEVPNLPIFVTEATVTFNRDVAPVLFDNCAVCHRPGEVAPFSVLSYEDVRPWAWLIGIVTQNGYMPPWPPGDRADAPLAGKRSISEAEIALIQQWLAEGAVEGNPADLPEPPQFDSGWQLGKPDLVLRLPEPFTLAGAGIDAYRNLVLPLPLEQVRWVKGLEIRPGNKRIVHHAIMQVDRFGTGRRLDADDDAIGFDGMYMGSAENPGGHFIGWTPGKAPWSVPDDMAWKVEPGTDLVLQLHMLPSGETERIAPEIALYFADRPATQQPSSLVLRASDIDIPAGAVGYAVHDFVELPVDVDVLGIYPHAHYLAKDIKATAELPDGRLLTLIHIDDWDFGWQDEYRYLKPVKLPAGTIVSMRYEYDNSAGNPRNPNQPPRRVVAGNRSSDEMAVLSLQIMTTAPNGEARIDEALMRRRVEQYPQRWIYHNLLGVALRAQGKTPEAIDHFLQAQRLNPGYAGVAYNLGNAYQSTGRVDEAIGYYRQVLELDPDHGKVHNNLGSALQARGEFERAIVHYQAQLELNPSNVVVRFNLGTALLSLDRFDSALESFEQTLALDPGFVPARVARASVLHGQGRPDEAIDEYRRAIELDRNSANAYYGLALIELETGETQSAVGLLTKALHLDATLAMPLNNLAWRLATRPSAADDAALQALALAELVADLDGSASAEVLDTLAAAYAATGQFKEASRTLRSALSLVGEEHRYTPEFRQRLALYERGEAYRVAPGT